MDDITAVPASNDELTAARFFGGPVRLLKDPRGLYAEMPKSGGYGAPTLYALFWLFVATLAEFGVSKLRPQPVRLGLSWELAWLFFGPVLTLLLGYAAAAFLFVVWHLMGSKENYQTAFRCWALMAPVAVISALLGVAPFLPLVVFAYGAFLLVTASREVHGLPAGRSWAVWGTLCGLLLAMTLVSAFAGRAQRGPQGSFSRPTLSATPALPKPAASPGDSK